MGRRGPKPQYSLDDVLDAAHALIADNGLADFTLGRLARSLGTSISGLYRYVSGKEALMVLLQERALARYDAELAQVLIQDVALVAARDLSTPVAALRHVLVGFGHYLEHAVKQPARHRLIAAFLAAPDPVLTDEQAAAVNKHLARTLGQCANLLESAAASGAITAGDAMVRTHLLWAGLQGLGLFRKRDRIQPPELRVKPLTRALFEATLLGFGADPTQLAEAFATLD